MNWYVEVLKKYAVFDGRARRMEYWMYVLINFIISFGLGFVEGIAKIPLVGGVIGPISLVYSLAVFLPGLAVSVRRLHDINKSGWWLLIAFIPLIGGLILLLFMVRPGDTGRNDFGSDPIRAERKKRRDDDYDDRDERYDDDEPPVVRPRRRED